MRNAVLTVIQWLIAGIICGLFLSLVWTAEAQDASEALQIEASCSNLLLTASADVEYVFVWQEDEQELLRWFTADSGYETSLSFVPEQTLIVQVGLYTGASTSFYYTTGSACNAEQAPPAPVLDLSSVRDVLSFLEGVDYGQ